LIHVQIKKNFKNKEIFLIGLKDKFFYEKNLKKILNNFEQQIFLSVYPRIFRISPPPDGQQLFFIL
jgi:hypothetical protein